jgi:hypothetical protein
MLSAEQQLSLPFPQCEAKGSCFDNGQVAYLRRKSLDVADVICTYGCDASEEEVEAAILAETGYKTPWIPYTLEEFAEKLNADLPTFHEEDLPEEVMTSNDVPPVQSGPAARLRRLLLRRTGEAVRRAQ